jgi:hypothetical protein
VLPANGAVAMSGSGPPAPTRKAYGRLNKFVARHAPVDGLLPLVHITRAYAFDAILDGDSLEPSVCDVFKDKILYLFYGRPAYRAKEGNNARLEFEWPIVFVFDAEKVSEIKRIFPFDTGAFAQQLYSDFFDKESQFMDFALTPSLETARKFVGTFYQDNNEYYQGETRKNVDIPLRQFEAQGIYELARLPGVQSSKLQGKTRDERSSALEVQVAQAISLKDALIALVLPEPYLDDKDIQEALIRWNVKEVHTYATLHNMSGEAWVGEIYSIIHRLYKRLGFLK